MKSPLRLATRCSPTSPVLRGVSTSSEPGAAFPDYLRRTDAYQDVWRQDLIEWELDGRPVPVTESFACTRLRPDSRSRAARLPNHDTSCGRSRQSSSSFSAERGFSFRHDFADAWYDLVNPALSPTPMTVRFRTTADDFPANPEFRRDLARSHHNLGLVLREAGRLMEAEQLYRQILAVDGNGLVFAVSWSGPYLPDLKELLGSHFGMLVSVYTARSMRTMSGLCASICDVSSSLACQPGVSSFGFSISPSSRPV
jgi:hypothetical protein